MALYLVVQNPGRTNLLPYEIGSFHAAPTREALGTISHALQDLRRRGEIPRTDVTYALAPFREYRTVDISWPEAKEFGLAPRGVSDRPPRADEDATLHQDRVVSWFTNHLMPAYESGLVNTAVVADEAAVAWIVDYLVKRGGLVPGARYEGMEPGGIFKFTPDGFRLVGHGVEYSPVE